MALASENKTQEEIDFLENDSPIPGQNYVCLSFVSPEKCIQDKQIYMMYHFMKDKHGFSGTFNEYKKTFGDYVAKEHQILQKKYNGTTDFTTSVRGLKVRGVYDSMVEAKYRAKQLQRKDPQFNVFVGQVGFWLPWDPEPGEIKDQEYLNEQLNTLMKSYHDNQSQKNMLWEQNKSKTLENVNENNDGETKEAISKTMESEDPWMINKLVR